MKVYLAQAIDQAGTDGKAQWQVMQVEKIEAAILRYNPITWVFNPRSAFSVAREASLDPSIRAINALALEQSDVLVAYLPAGVVSVGVPMEIERFASTGKPVILISDANSWMLEFEDPSASVFRIHDTDDWGTRLLDALHWSSGVLSQSLGTLRQDLPVVRDYEGAKLPTRAYPDDAGLDLYVYGDHVVQPGTFKDIPSGVSVQLPDWSWGMLTGRSSTLRSRGLMVTQGVIDAGYRGPLFAGVWNLTDQPVHIKDGERLSQLIVLDNATRKLEVLPVQVLATSDRGNQGFGSSGS